MQTGRVSHVPRHKHLPPITAVPPITGQIPPTAVLPPLTHAARMQVKPTPAVVFQRGRLRDAMPLCQVHPESLATAPGVATSRP